MSIVRRMINGTFANAAGIGFSAVMQILSVPVLTSAWGVEGYGIWLMLTTIPTYFALSDLGFAAAATSDMTMQVARGAQDQVLRTFHSLWVLVGTISFLAIAFGSLLFVLPQSSPNKTLNWISENADVIFLIVVYAAVALSSRITLAAFRATGNYARGTLAYDSLVLCEGMTMLIVAWSGGGYRQCIIAQLIFRTLNIVLLNLWLRKSVPWLSIGIAHASRTEFRRLLAPALAAMAIPTALALNLQGMVLVVGTVLSPVAAATLTPVRTASRLVIQGIGTINRATVPELSSAVARHDAADMARVVWVNLASVGILLVPGAIAFAFFGRTIVETWTNGHIVPNSPFVILMALAMVLHGLWYYTANLLLASNSHTELAGSLLLTSIASICIAVPAANVGGLNGVAIVMLVAEAACIARVAQIVARQEFMKSINFRSVLGNMVASARR